MCVWENGDGVRQVAHDVDVSSASRAAEKSRAEGALKYVGEVRWSGRGEDEVEAELERVCICVCFCVLLVEEVRARRHRQGARHGGEEGELHTAPRVAVHTSAWRTAAKERKRAGPHQDLPAQRVEPPQNATQASGKMRNCRPASSKRKAITLCCRHCSAAVWHLRFAFFPGTERVRASRKKTRIIHWLVLCVVLACALQRGRQFLLFFRIDLAAVAACCTAATGNNGRRR